jgi:tetratricopeptide (TPR) repeat protein
LPGEESIELMGGGARHLIVMLYPDPKASGVSDVPTDDPLVSVGYLAASEKARKEVDEARKARRKGNCKSAIGHGKKAIEIAPTFALAYVETGMCQLMEADMSAAESSFQGAIQQDPKFLYGYIGLAHVQIKREHWNDAARALGQANQADPDRAEPFYELAKLQLRTGHLDKAELAAKTALTKDYTRIPDAPFLLARVYLLEGKKMEAIECLQKIADTNSAGEIKERAQRSIEMIRADKNSKNPAQ